MSISITLGAIIGATMGGTEVTPDLQARLEAAEARIAELAATQNADWMTEQRSEQIRGLVQDVLSDADTRASLQGSGATAGYNNGFFVQSADGKWSMTINGVFQERVAYLSGTGVDAAGNDSNWGFESTRTLLNFSGTIAGSAYYNMRMGWSPYGSGSDNNAGLQWAYGGFDLSDTMTVQIGRQKYDVMRSYIVNAEHQMSIERAMSAGAWATSNITNGIKLMVDQDNFRGNVMLSNQATAGSANGNFAANVDGWAVSARGEFLMEGDWSQFDAIGSGNGESTGMMVGIGASSMGDLDLGAGAFDAWNLTGDLSYDADGWSAMIALTTGEQAAVNGDQWGATVELGYWLSDTNQLYTTWDYLDRDAGDNMNLWNLGVAHHVSGNTKLSVELGYALDNPATLLNGVNANRWSGNGENDWNLTCQLQVSF
ncbi:MAG: hypothetical protein MK074_02610 [Phycisphaerales bacterium]|nr:hypothetical protein [Phycisphaerales bacterium]